MSGAWKGFLITSLIWVLLLGAYSLIEYVRGNMPFAMYEWSPGGKYITLTVIFVLALGTLIGYSSDRLRRSSGR